MTKKWRRLKRAHCGLPMCLLANWPRKFDRASCRLAPFGAPVMERLRSTDFWIAVVRLRVTDCFCETIPWRTPVGPLTVRVVVTLRLPTHVLARMRGDESWRL